MADNRILKSPLGQKLYKEYAKDLPIVDYHNPLSIEDVLADRVFENITQLWIASDPYKHRAMRILGVPEKYITGLATDMKNLKNGTVVYRALWVMPFTIGLVWSLKLCLILLWSRLQRLPIMYIRRLMRR